MFSAEEIRKMGARLSSLFMGLEPVPVRVAATPSSAAPARKQHTYEINLSVVQVLVAFTSTFSAAGLLLWAILKLWLFEP